MVSNRRITFDEVKYNGFIDLQLSFIMIYQLDRFIPNISAMDFDYAHYMLIETKNHKENPIVISPS
ncbi:hypothetical protein R6Q59_036345 [Mikania micrantha]